MDPRIGSGEAVRFRILCAVLPVRVRFRGIQYARTIKQAGLSHHDTDTAIPSGWWSPMPHFVAVLEPL